MLYGAPIVPIVETLLKIIMQHVDVQNATRLSLDNISELDSEWLDLINVPAPQHSPIPRFPGQI